MAKKQNNKPTKANVTGKTVHRKGQRNSAAAPNKQTGKPEWLQKKTSPDAKNTKKQYRNFEDEIDTTQLTPKQVPDQRKPRVKKAVPAEFSAPRDIRNTVPVEQTRPRKTKEATLAESASARKSKYATATPQKVKTVSKEVTAQRNAQDTAPTETVKAPRTPKTDRKPAITEEPPAATEPIQLMDDDTPGFDTLGLDENILKAISNLGYEIPTPIQTKAIPPLLEGHDLIGLAQTGTGKTAAFGLPLIQMIDPSSNIIQAIVLEPTRELAIQVAGSLHELARFKGLRVTPVYGGQPIDRQFRALRDGAHIVVGTPGRVLDHIRRGSISLDKVQYCVFDEADEMLALGFLEDVETILAELPEERQTAFFSATMAPRVFDLTRRFLKNPVQVEIESKQRTIETTRQTYYDVPRGHKQDVLARVLDMETPGPTIIFCRTRQDTATLAESLRLRGYLAEPLHGDMGQPERDRVMKRFREGQADLLIATDVAARGLDIESVTHVINYDIPWDIDQYIHRIGRTGRAGREGDAITLVEGRERRALQAIEKNIGTQITRARIPTPADIAARRRDQLVDAIRKTLEDGQYDSHLPTIDSLSEEFDPSDIAAAVLSMLWQERHSSSDEEESELEADWERPETGMVRLFVGMGRQAGLRPGDLVGAISNETGISGRTIGAIDILDNSAFVEVPRQHADEVIRALTKSNIRGRKVKVMVTTGSDDNPERRDKKRRRRS